MYQLFSSWYVRDYSLPDCHKSIFIFLCLDIFYDYAKEKLMTITPAQIRAARALLNWTAGDLTKRSGVAQSTLSMIENGQSEGMKKTLSAIESALTNGGVEFQVDGGVRPRQTTVTQLRGLDGFKQFMDDVYEVASLPDDPGISVINVDNEQFIKWLGEKEANAHLERMEKLDIQPVQCLISKAYKTNIAEKYSNYRRIDDDVLNGNTLYIYGHKAAIIEFGEKDVEVMLIDNPSSTSMFRNMFNAVWTLAKDVKS